MRLAKKNKEANKLVPEFKKIDRTLDKAEFVCTKTDGTKYEFNRFALPLKFEAIDDQVELEILINNLKRDYNPRNLKKIEEKNKVLKSAKKLFVGRKDIIVFFEKGIFPYKGNVFKTKAEKSEEKIK